MSFFDTPMLGFHIGRCCGIKTIWDLGYDPDATAEALKKRHAICPDQYGNDVNSLMNLFVDKAPEETYLERVDRYLAYLKVVRPHGIVEIVLVDSTSCDEGCMCGEHQTRTWQPLLEERGFKVVSDCYNSNSGNRIYVMHLCMDKE
jgi:hypothetical protein